MSDWKPSVEGVFYNLDADLYHRAPGVSHSMLKHMDPPARLPAYLSQPHEATSAMIMGTLVHSLILEPDKPLPKIVVKPEGMKFSTTEGKEWKKQHEGLLILTQAEWETLHGCVKSIANHADAREVFMHGDSEVSCFHKADTDRADIFLKCRMDFVPFGDAIADIKTVQGGKAALDEFSKEIYEKRYYTQAAWYLDRWNHLNPQKPKKHFIFVAVEKEPPYLCAVYWVGEDTLNRGRRQNSEDLMRYIDGVVHKKWPGFEGVKEINIPPWAKAKQDNKDHAEWLLRVIANQV